jgi:hypothetical protein
MRLEEPAGFARPLGRGRFGIMPFPLRIVATGRIVGLREGSNRHGALDRSVWLLPTMAR